MFYFSTLWFADVAGAAVKYRRINGKTPDISRAASDFVHACLMELVFLVQAMFLYYIAIPIVSTVLGFYLILCVSNPPHMVWYMTVPGHAN